MKTVGVYEAKTQLPRLLVRVARGERITITRHGVPVATLVPVESRQRRPIGHVVADLQVFARLLAGATIAALSAGCAITPPRMAARTNASNTSAGPSSAPNAASSFTSPAPIPPSTKNGKNSAAPTSQAPAAHPRPDHPLPGSGSSY